MKCRIYDDERNLGTVEGKIHSVVKAMKSDVDYKFMNWVQVNEALDKMEKPTVVYVLPASGQLSVSWNKVKDAPTTLIAFLSGTDFDFSGHRNDNVIERMKRLFAEFVKAYNESGLFKEIEGTVPYQVIYDGLDENVTGIVVTLRIEELQGISLCDDAERLEPDDYEDDDEDPDDETATDEDENDPGDEDEEPENDDE